MKIQSSQKLLLRGIDEQIIILIFRSDDKRWFRNIPTSFHCIFVQFSGTIVACDAQVQTVFYILNIFLDNPTISNLNF